MPPINVKVGAAVLRVPVPADATIAVLASEARRRAAAMGVVADPSWKVQVAGGWALDEDLCSDVIAPGDPVELLAPPAVAAAAPEPVRFIAHGDGVTLSADGSSVTCTVPPPQGSGEPASSWARTNLTVKPGEAMYVEFAVKSGDCNYGHIGLLTDVSKAPLLGCTADSVACGWCYALHLRGGQEGTKGAFHGSTITYGWFGRSQDKKWMNWTGVLVDWRTANSLRLAFTANGQSAGEMAAMASWASVTDDLMAAARRPGINGLNVAVLMTKGAEVLEIGRVVRVPDGALTREGELAGGVRIPLSAGDEGGAPKPPAAENDKGGNSGGGNGGSK